jgi:hypothetical protein
VNGFKEVGLAASVSSEEAMDGPFELGVSSRVVLEIHQMELFQSHSRDWELLRVALNFALRFKSNSYVSYAPIQD